MFVFPNLFHKKLACVVRDLGKRLHIYLRLVGHTVLNLGLYGQTRIRASLEVDERVFSNTVNIKNMLQGEIEVLTATAEQNSDPILCGSDLIILI